MRVTLECCLQVRAAVHLTNVKLEPVLMCEPPSASCLTVRLTRRRHVAGSQLEPVLCAPGTEAGRRRQEPPLHAAVLPVGPGEDCHL